MEIQIKNNNSLEKEKTCFLKAMCNFLDTISFEDGQVNGRPKVDQGEILKHLLVMSYNSMSYRRAISDLNLLYKNGFISKLISRSTLNDFANNNEAIQILERLVQVSATFFKDTEDTLIVDSTWFAEKMYVGGCSTVHGHKQGLLNTRKIHVGILQNSKIICYAKATIGTFHDSPAFEDILVKSAELFDLKSCLGDKAYSSKNNYILCGDRGIKGFLDFKKHVKENKGKSSLWREQVNVWKNKPELWHESYRYRVLVESVFFVMKKKFGNYLRSRNENSRDVEMLLKCLVYNLSLIGKHVEFGHF